MRRDQPTQRGGAATVWRGPSMFPAGWDLRNGSLETGSHGGGLLEGATLAQCRRSKSACSSACLLNVQSVPREGVTPASDIRAEPAACLRTEKVQGESRGASKPLQFGAVHPDSSGPTRVDCGGREVGCLRFSSRETPECLASALRGPRGSKTQRRHCRMSRPPDGSEASTPTSATERRRRRRKRERSESGR